LENLQLFDERGGVVSEIDLLNNYFLAGLGTGAEKDLALR
jgi:hypothetical protein